jgi:hypothetical protein
LALQLHNRSVVSFAFCFLPFTLTQGVVVNDEARALLQTLIAESGGLVAVLLDQHGTVLASAGSQSPLAVAQHALTIAQGMFAMSAATGIPPSARTITDVDHGPDVRLLLSIVRGNSILALLRDPQAPTPHEPFTRAALALDAALEH